MAKNDTFKEVADINGCKVFIENGEVKTVLSEEILRNGYMDVETWRKIVLEVVRKAYERGGGGVK